MNCAFWRWQTMPLEPQLQGVVQLYPARGGRKNLFSQYMSRTEYTRCPGWREQGWRGRPDILQGRCPRLQQQTEKLLKSQTKGWVWWGGGGERALKSRHVMKTIQAQGQIYILCTKSGRILNTQSSALQACDSEQIGTLAYNIDLMFVFPK